MRVSHLPLRVGLIVAVVAFAVVIVHSLLADEFAILGAFLGSVVIALVAYFSVRRFVGDGVQAIERQLLAIRNKNFEIFQTESATDGDEFVQLSQAVRDAGRAVQKEMEDLKKMESYRRDFIGDVSHELKTPIFAIKGFSETLLDGALGDASVNQAFVEKILRNAERLDNLARDLSEISRIETGELKMEIMPFSLTQTVEEVIESLESRATAKGILLKSVMPANLPTALGDGERVRQVLVNLVDNAIKYTNWGGTVEVVARAVGQHTIKVSVVDNGIGVVADHVPRLTERFYRVDKSRSRSQGGTGLGLSIVKHILGAHGKKLQISSVEGKGSTFGFTLDTTSTGAEVVDDTGDVASVAS